jgi:surface polysaccharide O-acyltransferase-like enzyme
MKEQQNAEHLLWADALRALATVSVIILHISGSLVNQFGTVSGSFWTAGSIFDGSVRFCVPVFVMLTGALLLPKDEKTGIFLKKRLIRVVLPLAFWSAVYIAYELIPQFLHGDKTSFKDIARYIYHSVQYGSSPHFWYVYMIIGIYLFIPVIGPWIRKGDEKGILYFLLIWLIALIINQPLISKYKVNIDLTYFTGYLGYLVLGYYLSVRNFKSTGQAKVISVLLILLGIGITIVMTGILSSRNDQYVKDFYNYLSPNVLMAAIGVFFIVKNLKITNSPVKKLISVISRYSFGIYLVHILVLHFLKKVGIDWDLVNPFIGIPVTALVCLAVSTGIVYVINKIPYGKYISG